MRRLIQLNAGIGRADYSLRRKPPDEEKAMEGWWQEHRVRERAYEIWEREGRPEGKADAHWRQAEAEIAAEAQGLEQEVELEAAGAV